MPGEKWNTAIKIRLYPSPEQAELMEKTFGCCRWLWNHILADVQEFYAATDLQFIPTPAHYKKEAPFLREVDSQPLCTVHQNLRRAFLDFFRNPGAFQYPQFKTKKSGKDSFTVYCRQYRTGPSIRLLGNGLQMPKLGFIKAAVHRKPLHWWDLRMVTVSRTAAGKYFASVIFAYQAKKQEAVEPTQKTTLGLNHSISSLYVDSEGRRPEMPSWKQPQKKLAEMQRKLSRMQKGSRNYQEQQQKIRLLHEHIANQRRDFIHKESRRIANAWDAVCVRDADLNDLAQKLKGAKVMASGFGMFRDCLRYKLQRQGKACITVDRYTPTAKTCHECGFVHEGLGQREKIWTCPHCGAALSREVNAARNLRDMGLFQYKSKETSAA
jgi:putative transposase